MAYQFKFEDDSGGRSAPGGTPSEPGVDSGGRSAPGGAPNEPGVDIGGPLNAIPGALPGESEVETLLRQKKENPSLYTKRPEFYPGQEDSSYITSVADTKQTFDPSIFELEKLHGVGDDVARYNATRFTYDPESIWGAPQQYQDKGLNPIQEYSKKNIQFLRNASDMTREKYLQHLGNVQARAEGQGAIAPRMAELAMQRNRANMAATSDPRAIRQQMSGLVGATQQAGSRFAPMAAEELLGNQNSLLAGYDSLRGQDYGRGRAEEQFLGMQDAYNLKRAVEDEKAKQSWHSLGLQDKFNEDAAQIARRRYADELLREETVWDEATDKKFRDFRNRSMANAVAPVVNNTVSGIKKGG